MIETKLVNGLKVVYNHFDNLVLVTLSDNKVNELKDFLDNEPDSIIVIHPTLYGGEFDLTFDVHDLEVLKDLSEIKKVILNVGSDLHSHSGIYYLKDLKQLDSWLSSNVDLDFSFFKKLENVSFNWTSKTKNFFECTSLKNIRIWKYKGNERNFIEFQVFKDLEYLGIIQSNVISLLGIEKLKHLKRLELSYNLNLEIKIKDFDFELQNIEELEINSCKKVNLDFIKIFPNLKKLTLVKFQDIKELRPILDGLPKLEELFVGETKIIETDNRYYLSYPRIKHFFFEEKKYHIIKNEDLNSIA